MKYPVLFALAISLLTACGEKKPKPTAALPVAKDSVDTPRQYFPVMSFIRGEIAYVDSLPVGIKKYSPQNGKGYVYIKPEEFHRLAAEFMPAEISDSLFLKQYHETSFLDRSSNAATFFYTPKNDSLTLKRVDVLTVKGDVYDKVKSVYLQRNYRSGDSFYVKKLYWKPQKSFQIITEAVKGSGQPTTSIVNVVWDNVEEQ